MSRFTSRRGIIAAVLAISVATAAYAYWTAGGSGTGSATAGDTDPLTANQTSTLTPMYPGDSNQTLSGDFDNPNPGPVYVTSVTAAIDSVTGGAGACDATDFTLSSATMAIGRQVAAGDGVDSWSGAQIRFNNKATNQDGCKGATVNLSYTIN